MECVANPKLYVANCVMCRNLQAYMSQTMEYVAIYKHICRKLWNMSQFVLCKIATGNESQALDPILLEQPVNHTTAGVQRVQTSC